MLTNYLRTNWLSLTSFIFCCKFVTNVLSYLHQWLLITIFYIRHNFRHNYTFMDICFFISKYFFISRFNIWQVRRVVFHQQQYKLSAYDIYMEIYFQFRNDRTFQFYSNTSNSKLFAKQCNNCKEDASYADLICIMGLQ